MPLAGIGDVNQVVLGKHNTADTFTYFAKVDGDCDNLSKKFIVQVHEKPVVAPIDPVKSCEGDILLEVKITGTDFKGVEWTFATDPAVIGNGTNYTISGARHPDDVGTYHAKVTTDHCGDVQTDVLVDVYEPISYDAIDNLNPTPCEGAPLKLVVEGIGDDVKYSWHKEAVTGNPSDRDKQVIF